jgi:copper chaperone CopZ
MAVTRAVGTVPGVSGVEVNLEEGTVRFNYDESSVQLDSVREAIRGEGYEVVA